MGKNNKLLDFQASISDVQQINPLFSTCKVRVLYTGKNRNMSIINKDAVERALPTLKNIPIVGEYNEAVEDYRGHGGAIDLDSYKYIHTTKPYGVVPESATYEWEEIRGREYLTINGCYLWTGRYEEARSVIENGKGQSMEIEVTDGEWVEEEEAYRIDNFVFSALCILGDDVEPAFEDASIVAYSFDKDSFKQEFTKMMSELKFSLSQNEKEVNSVLKELLEKYSLTIEDLTAKGIKFDEISEDELEAKIIEVFEIDVNAEPEGDNPEGDNDPENHDDNQDDGDNGDEGDNDDEPNDDDDANDNDDDDEGQDDNKEEFEALKAELQELKESYEKVVKANEDLTKEVETLREFKLNVEKTEHEAKVTEMFKNFQLTEEDVADLDIHSMSLEDIEEKCFAILGRKMASKKNFSKQLDNGIKLPVNNDKSKDEQPSPYGGLFEKYNK